MSTGRTPSLLPALAFLAWVVTAPAIHGQQNNDGVRGRGAQIGLAIQQGLMSRASASVGVGAVLSGALDSTATLVWPGAPVVRGSQAIAGLFGSLPQAVAREAFTQQPLHQEWSTDSSLIVEYGIFALRGSDAAPSPPQVGRYIAAWRSFGSGWRLGALALVNLPPQYTLPPDSSPATVLPPLEPHSGDSVVGAFVRADVAFASMADTLAIDRTFAAWVAPDGVTFSGMGPLNRGPEAVASALERLSRSRWGWAPVAAGAANDGSLGWTAGEATITVPATEQQPERVIRSTYLTLWRRQPDGSIRFIADGGSTRP